MSTNSQLKVKYGSFCEQRRDHNVDIKGVADAVGVSREHLSRIVNGRRGCPEGLAQRIADYFGVPVEDLFEPAFTAEVAADD